MLRPNFTHLSPFAISWFLIRISLLNLYEAQGLYTPYQINCSRFYCTPNFSYPQIRLGVDDAVVFENNLTKANRYGISFECDLLDFGSWRTVKKGDFPEERTYAVRELNLKNDSVQNPWMSCRFLRHLLIGKWSDWKWRKEYTPPPTPTQPFESYLNVSLQGTRGNGSLTHLFMNDTGIFVEQQLVAVWGENKGSISTDPEFKYLNSRDGHPCYSICVKRMPKNFPERSAMCNSGYKRDFQFCSPRDKYDIKKYAFNRVLSVQGLPCKTKCEWGFRSSDRMADGWGCGLRSWEEDPRDPNLGWCSPSPGLTYRGDNCTGPCTFQDFHYSSCAVAGESKRIPCSA